MSGDLLGKFRQVQKETHIETVEGQPYKAFESASAPQRRIDIRPAEDAQRIVSYGYLTEITHAGGVIVGLSFSNPPLLIRIEGRNLHNLIDLLREDKVTAIHEYIPEWHVKPGPNEAVVNVLQITEPGSTSRRQPANKH